VIKSIWSAPAERSGDGALVGDIGDFRIESIPRHAGWHWLDSQMQERVKEPVEGDLTKQLGDSLDLSKPTTRQRGTPTIFMRFVAGLWFAIVFGALALVYYSYLEDLRKFSFWNFSNLILSPALVAGLCGYILGGAIVAASDLYPGLFAALRGTAIGLICISFQVVNLAFFGTLFGQVRRDFMQFVWLVFYLTIFWGLWAAVPVMGIGAVAGLLLCGGRRLFARD
jgi:hypothetical protein